MRWPDKIEAGSICDVPVNGTDWLPTFCALAGAKLPEDVVLDGADVASALTSGGEVDRKIPMMWWLWHARGGYEVAMRDGDYKLVATMIPQADPGAVADANQPEGWSIMEFIKKAELGRFEMFNLKDDPSETSDLSKSQVERFQGLKQRMIQLHAEIRAEGPVYELTGKKRKPQESKGGKNVDWSFRFTREFGGVGRRSIARRKMIDRDW